MIVSACVVGMPCGKPGYVFERSVLEELCRQRPRIGIRNDPIVIAVHYQHRHRDFFKVARKIRLRKRHDTVVVSLRTTHHFLAPPILDYRFGSFRARPIEPVKRTLRQIAIELRAMSRYLGLKSVEYFFGEVARVSGRFYHQRRHRANEHRFCNPALAVPAQVSRDLASAGRVADVHCVSEIEMCR